MKVTVREDDEDYPLWPNDDFTGEWIVEWPSGALKFTGYYLNGLSHGVSRSYWENGKIAQSGESFEGKPIGIWEDFFEDGYKFKETIYEDSTNFIEKRFNTDGSISATKVFKNGIEIFKKTGF
jgi:antitoxin component YwqK of YwqJK toxin-antitoxin module